MYFKIYLSSILFPELRFLVGAQNPPLSHTPRSPRRHVVHPKVEGHTLTPATITMNRITLEDQRRYRMHVREESEYLCIQLFVYPVLQLRGENWPTKKYFYLIDFF